ncbi:RNA polymerase sigma-70 factor [Prevotella sp.]|uniref:RNA polymerase sigma-70 factor n=1 Tax=Prevotella sp. TaxID=59823 RepID=UPI002F94D2ED
MQPDIKELFELYYRQLCLYALHYVGTNEVAEDIVQECFVTLWQKQPDYPKAFLYTSVRNRCVDYLRHARLPMADVAAHDLENIISDDEARKRSETEARLWKAIDRLPERQRQVLLMSKRDGMRYREIAQELGISERTVEHQVSAAMKKLRG